MATTVAQAKAAIYSQLASAPTFHPSTADLFTDFTVESGDIYTVSSDSTSYSVPVYGMKLKWNGSSKVEVQNSGNVQRDPVEKMAQKKSRRGGRSYMNGNIVEDQIAGVRSSVTQLANSWSVVVEGTGQNAHIKPAVIQASIYAAGEGGTSKITLSADNIIIDGTLLTQSMVGLDITVTGLTTTYLNIEGTTSVPDNAYLGLATAGTSTQWKYLLVEAYVDSDNVLHILDLAGNEVTFSKATSVTLSGSWSGNTYTVSASPAGSATPISITPNVHFSEGTNYILTTHVAEYDSSTQAWTDHGNDVKAYLVTNGQNIELNNINQPSSAGAGVKTFAKIENWGIYDNGMTFQLGKIVPFAAPASNSPYDSRFTTSNKITSNGTYYACAEGYKSHDVGYSNDTYNADRYAQARAFVVDVASVNPYPYTRTMKCVSKTFSSSVWTYRFEIEVSSEVWNTNTNYKFHHNSGYT